MTDDQIRRMTNPHQQLDSALREQQEQASVMPSESPQPESPAADNGPAEARPLRVLVVEDNTDTVLTFALLLKALGHDVRTAHDGPTGVEVALAYQPDVALLDIGLPGLNGYEVAKRIRQEPTLRDTVLVALTGYGQETDREISRQAGFNHHMVKPANFDKLQQILTNVAEQLTPVGV